MYDKYVLWYLITFVT